MAQMQVVGGGMTEEGAKEEQNAQKERGLHFVNVDTPIQELIRLDSEGERIIFEHEVGKFKSLTDDELKGLSHETKVSYSISFALNAKHDPDNDELQQRIKVGEMRNHKSRFEQEVRTTVQSSVARKKMQAYVGHGFDGYWSRPDKVEQRLSQGWEFVDPRDKDVYAGVAAAKSATGDEKSGGHFEIRSKPGEPELILMRIPTEKRDEMMKVKQEAATRQEVALTSTGKREITQLGGHPVTGHDNLPWVDRK